MFFGKPGLYKPKTSHWAFEKHVAEICSVYTTNFSDEKTDIYAHISVFSSCVHRTNFSYVFFRKPDVYNPKTSHCVFEKHVAKICSVYTTSFSDEKTDI